MTWGTGDKMLAMVRRERGLRKKQNGLQVRKGSRWQSSGQLALIFAVAWTSVPSLGW